MKGRVIKSTGSFYLVTAVDGKSYSCRPRGKLRLEGYKESNPVAVGDWVEFDVHQNEGYIDQIYPRTNHVLRQSVKRTEHSSVLAANVDQAVLIATLVQPKTSLGFIDRFLVSCEAYRIPQILLFNKSDLYKKKEMQLFEDRKDSIKLTSLVSNVVDKETQEKIDIVKSRLRKNYGYCDVCATDVLNYVASIFARGDAKE